MLKLQSTDAKSQLVRKDPDAGKDWGQEKGAVEGEMDGITDSVNMSLSTLPSWWRTGKPGVLQSIGLQRVRHNLSN